MRNNLLVCGGMPRSGTTFLHNVISNRNGVFKSIFKETNLFLQKERFVDRKLRFLNKRKLRFLDFSPSYIFYEQALFLLEKKKVNCFFIIRNTDQYMISIKKYIEVNNIKNDAIKNLSEEHIKSSIRRARNNFLCLDFENVIKNVDNTLNLIERQFGIVFGDSCSSPIKKNDSTKRRHFFFNEKIENYVKPRLFGYL